MFHARRSAGLPFARRSLIAIAALGAATLGVADQPAAAQSLSPFAGYWHGGGSLVLDTGKTEQIRCRVEVTLREEGKEAVQAIQCASTGRDVIIRSFLTLDGPRLKGTWMDTSRGAQGTLDGRVRGATVSLTMSGPDVDAALTATSAGAHQDLSVSGALGPIRKISVRLKRRS